MKKIMIAALLLLSVAAAQAQTPTSNPFNNGMYDSLKVDQGRTNPDWQAHKQYGLNTPAGVANILKNRMLALKQMHSRTTYGRLYADITYLIASYGLRSANWVNGADAKAPANDPNRGLLNWNAHSDYVTKSAGYDGAAQLIENRIKALQPVLSKEDFARLYGDCSILLINFSRMN